MTGPPPLAILICTLSVLATSTPTFEKMRVKELRAYLAERNTECVGCMEKSEFVAKVREVSRLAPKNKPKASHNGKSKRKPKPTKENPKTPTPPSSAASREQIVQNVQMAIWSMVLLLAASLYIWQRMRRPMRRCLLKAWCVALGRTAQCEITMSSVKDPYWLPCCGQICEREALAMWMGKSSYYRKDESLNFRQVAPCPHCRQMFAPAVVRNLLTQCDVCAPRIGEFAIDSGVPDPAFSSGCAAHENFVLLKTREDLEEEVGRFRCDDRLTNCAAEVEENTEIDSQSEPDESETSNASECIRMHPNDQHKFEAVGLQEVEAPLHARAQARPPYRPAQGTYNSKRKALEVQTYFSKLSKPRELAIFFEWLVLLSKATRLFSGWFVWNPFLGGSWILILGLGNLPCPLPAPGWDGLAGALYPCLSGTVWQVVGIDLLVSFFQGAWWSGWSSLGYWIWGGCLIRIMDAIMGLRQVHQYRRKIIHENVTWIKVGAARKWNRIPRWQQLQPHEFVQGAPAPIWRSEAWLGALITGVWYLMTCPHFFSYTLGHAWWGYSSHIISLGDLMAWYLLVSFLNMVLAKVRRSVFVVSHAWLSERHPDPDSSQLKSLLVELDRNGAKDEDVFFYDYCSLPQWDKEHPDFQQHRFKLPRGHPARRTRQQEQYFQRILGVMHLLYTWKEVLVLVLPQVPTCASNNTAYEDRGWTCFELAVSSYAGTVCNSANPHVERVLDILSLPKMSLAEVKTEFESKKFTQKGDKDKIFKMYEEVELACACNLDCVARCGGGDLWNAVFGNVAWR